MASRCKECGEPIAFKRLPNGKLCPTALDGGDHFDLCAKLKSERARANGTPFEDAKGRGVIWNGKRRYDYIRPIEEQRTWGKQ